MLALRSKPHRGGRFPMSPFQGSDLGLRRLFYNKSIPLGFCLLIFMDMAVSGLASSIEEVVMWDSFVFYNNSIPLGFCLLIFMEMACFRMVVFLYLLP